ncbi:DUF5522 domain-containing protein [Ilumatobacter sp.]|uniref:DUF5522 domain-containing protein n=1 Tax=Ilumatobacter sp. TaxID=1967498 RepID=UPI003B51FB38
MADGTTGRDRRREPSPERLRPGVARRDEILARHSAALESGEQTYADPATGYRVFTADVLAARGTCCESGCRHCPFV